MNSHNVVCYAGPTLEDNWADFGSDSSLLTVAGVFPLRGWSEQIICPNDPVLLEVYRRNLNVTDWNRSLPDFETLISNMFHIQDLTSFSVKGTSMEY